MSEEQRIEAYVKGTLSAKERAQVQARMASDPAFHEAVEAEQHAMEFMMDAEVLQLRSMMQKDLGNTPKGAPKGQTRWYYLGGGLALLLLLTWIAWPNQQLELDSQEEVATESTQKESVLEEDVQKPEIREPEVFAVQETIPEAEVLNPLMSTTSESFTEDAQGISPQTVDAPNIAEKLPSPDETTPTEEAQEPVVAKNTDPCQGINITGKVKATPVNLLTGELGTIAVREITLEGGTPPYQVALDAAPFGSEFEWYDMEAGTYTVRVQDSEGCSNVLKSAVEVKSTFCQAKSSRMFNLVVDGTLELNLGDDLSEASLLNISGQTVRTFDVYDDEWDGRDANGQEVSIGNYKLIATYPNNERCVFSITVAK